MLLYLLLSCTRPPPLVVPPNQIPKVCGPLIEDRTYGEQCRELMAAALAGYYGEDIQKEAARVTTFDED